MTRGPVRAMGDRREMLEASAATGALTNETQAGTPNYPQKLKVSEGYENINENSSRLYRSQILQVNTRWKALAEIYTIHSFAPLHRSLLSNVCLKNC